MNHQVVFITGAASGIGLAMARAFGTRGATVTLADLDAAKVAEAAAQLRSEGLEAESVAVDVTDRDALREAVAACAQTHGGLDVMCNNAGVGIGAEIRDMSPEDWRWIFEVNLFGVINGIDAAYPLMVEQGRGHIVNTASVAGLIPLPGEAAYVASKYAVVGLSHTLRAEAAALGVKVTTVCPGVVKTPIWDTSRFVGFDKDKVLGHLPKGITPESCAEQILSGMARNKATVVITPMAHLLSRFHRLSPGLYLKAAELYIRQMRRARTH